MFNDLKIRLIEILNLNFFEFHLTDTGQLISIKHGNHPVAAV
jgi:hypothetical protein